MANIHDNNSGLSKSWVVLNVNEQPHAENENITPNRVEDVAQLLKEAADSDSDGISVITDSACSDQTDEDESVDDERTMIEEVSEITEMIPQVDSTTLVESDNTVVREHINDNLNGANSAIFYACVVILIGILLNTFFFSEYLYESDDLERFYDQEDNDYSPLSDNHDQKLSQASFEPKILTKANKAYKKLLASKKEYRKRKDEGTHDSSEIYKKMQDLEIKEEYLRVKEKFLVEKEHDLMKQERQLHDVSENLNLKKQDSSENKIKKKEAEKSDNKENGSKKRKNYPEMAEVPRKRNSSGDWYMDLQKGRSNSRKEDYPARAVSDRFYSKGTKRMKSHWYFSRMLERQRLRHQESK